MKAMIIDDEESVRMLLEEILEQLGFEVKTAEDCREGYDFLKESGVLDLALVDWRTPNMSGIEFVKAVRTDPKFNDMKLLMVTGLNQMEDVKQALDAGVNEYLMKPFTLEMVANKIALLGFDVKKS